MHDSDPEGLRLPVKLDTACNGEFFPIALDPLSRETNLTAQRRATDYARRLGKSRRAYLKSHAGAASFLATMNETFAAAGKVGGHYAVPQDASFDDDAALSVLGGAEFIFDVHLHHMNPHGAWRTEAPRWEASARRFSIEKGNVDYDPVHCLDANHLLKEVFFDSDTTCAVLSAVPAAPHNPLEVEEAAATRSLVEMVTGSRLLIHGMALPNYPGNIEAMGAVQADYDVAAWKTYTQWGPDGQGFWLDDEETGIRFIEKVREFGVKRIAVHKGVPIGEMGSDHGSCRDIGIVARRYPDVDFLVYHAGYEPLIAEEAYREDLERGVNTLVRTLRENGIGPGENVYADLGTTWRFVMRDPDQAAHVLGKLLLAVGEDNILWGTDSIWYGSPQDQIQAFRAFEISQEFQERFGYPALTPLRKRKIFGLNGAHVYGLDPAQVSKNVDADALGRAKAAYLERRDPSFLTYGPKTRQEFEQFLMLNGGAPG